MKKKDIIQLVKKTIKEVEQSQHVQRSSGFGTSAIAPADKDPYTGEDEYPYSVRPKRTATGMMEDKLDEEGQSWGLDIRKLADSFTFEELEQLKNDGKITPEDYNGAVGYLQAWADQHPNYLKQRDFDDENSFGYETIKALRDKYLSEEMEKDYGDKIKPDNFKNNEKLQPGKKVTYLGTSRTIVKNNGIILTLDNGTTVNLGQFNQKGAIKEKTMKKIKEAESPEETAAKELELKALLAKKKAIDTKMNNVKMGKDSVTENELEEDMSVSNEDIETLDALVKKYNAASLIGRINVLKDRPLSYNPKAKSAELDDEDNEQKWDDVKQDIASMMEAYMKERAGDNLMEHMDKHKKRARLMESAWKDISPMFKQEKNDDAIIQHYITKGIAPEHVSELPRLVKSFRDKWNSIQKIQTDLKILDQEAEQLKQSTQPVVNGMEGGMEEEKQLSSGIFNETK